MKGFFTPVPDGRYELKAFAVDEERIKMISRRVAEYAEKGKRLEGREEARKGGRSELRLRAQRKTLLFIIERIIACIKQPSTNWLRRSRINELGLGRQLMVC
jgi:hypothetical protein